MAHINYSFTAGDTGSKVRVRLIHSLTGQLLVPFNGVYNAYIWVKPQGLTSTRRTMNILSGVNDGFVEYTLLSTELVEGELQTQVEIMRISDGTVVSELGVKVHKVGPKLSV